MATVTDRNARLRIQRECQIAVFPATLKVSGAACVEITDSVDQMVERSHPVRGLEALGSGLPKVGLQGGAGVCVGTCWNSGLLSF